MLKELYHDEISPSERKAETILSSIATTRYI